MLPEHLPRTDVMLNMEGGACPGCGGPFHQLCKTISEILDGVPAQLRVMRIRRPKYGCTACGAICQIPAPIAAASVEQPSARSFAKARLNGVGPYAYFADSLQRMVDGHLMSRIDDLLPRN